MPKQSAGILLYKIKDVQLQVFLVHPGGPFFKHKDDGFWSIPKGEYLEDEDPLDAAIREFSEETGKALPQGSFTELMPVKLKGGKMVHAWAMEGDIDHQNIRSNQFEMEWPPKSGKKASFDEIDRAGWFMVETAKVKINGAQVALIEELERILAAG